MTVKTAAPVVPVGNLKNSIPHRCGLGLINYTSLNVQVARRMPAPDSIKAYFSELSESAVFLVTECAESARVLR
jgi:hypothetical protein